MAFYLFTIGCVSILGQVVVLRELVVAFYGVELIYILALSLWLLSTAAGAFVGRRDYTPPVYLIQYLIVGVALLLPADVAFIRAVRLLPGAIPGAFLSPGRQILALGAALLPVGFLMGLLFQWAAKGRIARSGTLAGAYAIESAGGLFGGLAATWMLMAGIQNFVIGVLCGVFASGATLVPNRAASVRVRPWSILAIAILTTLLLKAPALDRHMTAWNHPHLLESRDSPYSRVTITGREGQFAVFQNDAFGFESQGTTAEEFIHLAAIYHPHPRTVLLAGGGMEGMLTEIGKYHPERIDYVELDPVLIDLTRKHLPRSRQAALLLKNTRVFVADPRSFLEGADPYDLILTAMQEPSSGQANRFYTRDYFEICRAKLSPGGVFAFRLPSAENLWTPVLSYRNASVYRALKSVFHEVVVLPGITNTIVASNDPLTRNPDLLARRFEEKRITSRLITEAYIRYVHTNDRYDQIARILSTTDAPENTDVRPVCYPYAFLRWLSKLFPGIRNQIPGRLIRMQAPPLIDYLPLLAIWVLLVLWARRFFPFRQMVLVILAGFLGMVTETLLLLYYQVKSGILFQDIGLLLTAFMGGLTVGAAVIVKVAKREVESFGKIRKRYGRFMAAGFLIFQSVLFGFFRFCGGAGVVPVSLLLFSSGVLVSGLFGYVSLTADREQNVLVSPFYAADLVGGCVGSLAASLILIPLLGMDGTAGLLLLFSTAVFVLV